MADLNTITIIGRVGQEPECKAFDSGAVLTKFSLANNQYDAKKKEDITHWFYVETFSKLGDYISKGKLVAVNGKLKQSTWTNEQGETKSRIYIFADNVQILTPKDKEKTEENLTENDKNLVQFGEIFEEEIKF